MSSFRTQRERLVDAGGIDHHVADLTVTVSADVTLAELQEKLAQSDQWLPIDGDPRLTLGTLVETNSTGPLRLGFGAWRDLLLGMQFASRAAMLITAGGRTMKNVAGYDLTKFMVGQHGLFGKVETITTRTYKRPEAALLVRFELSDKKISELLPTTRRPHWAMLSDGLLYCGYLGDEKTIAYQQSAGGLRQSLQEDIDFRAARWAADRPAVHFRASMPPSRILEFAAHAHLNHYAADAAFGIVVGSYPAHQKIVIHHAAELVGGKAFFEDPADVRLFYDVKGAELELMQRIQLAFNE